MKTCKYCGTENADASLKCKQCGANEFTFKCNNCGTTFEKGFCPNCGVKAGAVEKVCPKCGEKYFTAACPSCGYTPARGVTDEPHPSIIVKQEEPKKKGTFWKVLLWIFFLPVMAIIAIWKAKKLPKAWKIILTVIIAFITLLYGIGASKNADSTGTDTTIKATSTIAPTSEMPTPEPTEKPVSDGKFDNAAIMGSLNVSLKDAYGDSYSLEYDDESSMYTICVWADGVVQTAMMAKNGDADAKAKWDEVKNSLLIVCDAAKAVAVDGGNEKASVFLSLLNEANADNALLMITGGYVVYDAVSAD